MSPNFLERRGWTKSTLKAGDTVTVDYNPMKDGKNGHEHVLRSQRLDPL